MGRSSAMLVALQLMISLSLPVCHALPKFLVDSGKPKCVTISVPENTHLRVAYEAPDLDPNKGPVWVTINQVRSLERLRDKIMAHRHKPKKKEQAPISEELKTKVGTLKHKIDADGEVSVCIRASTASSINPMRFGLHCTTGRSSSELAKQKEDDHLSKVEIQLVRLKDEMTSILKEADFAKEREMVFHSQSVSMNAASMWWPIVQLIVLLVTGFTQARHMVGFFKSRNIV